MKYTIFIFETNMSYLRARIYGLQASGYDDKKQKQLLEGLLKESEDFFGPQPK